MLQMTEADADFDSSEAEMESEDSVVSLANDARLVEAARHGDTDAFGKLVQRYERRVMKVIRRFMADQDTAQDLAQNAFLKAFDRLEQFDPSRRFGPWLFRIAVNTTYDHLRKLNARDAGLCSAKLVRIAFRIPKQQTLAATWICRRKFRQYWKMFPKPIAQFWCCETLKGFQLQKWRQSLNAVRQQFAGDWRRLVACSKTRGNVDNEALKKNNLGSFVE